MRFKILEGRPGDIRDYLKPKVKLGRPKNFNIKGDKNKKKPVNGNTEHKDVDDIAMIELKKEQEKWDKINKDRQNASLKYMEKPVKRFDFEDSNNKRIHKGLNKPAKFGNPRNRG